MLQQTDCHKCSFGSAEEISELKHKARMPSSTIVEPSLKGTVNHILFVFRASGLTLYVFSRAIICGEILIRSINARKTTLHIAFKFVTENFWENTELHLLFVFRGAGQSLFSYVLSTRCGLAGLRREAKQKGLHPP